MMARKVSTLPALIAIGGHPYMIDGGAIDDVRDGCNIYPELAPGWDGAPFVLDDVDHGETIDIMGRRYQVNALSDLELVALAMPGESAYEDGTEDDGRCRACGAMLETGYPVRPWCPNGPHID